jgi:predicted nucleic acid-binding protein
MRALLDTCVLFPRVLRDLLLDAAMAGLFEPLWSDAILAELSRNLIEERGLSVHNATGLTRAMETFFPRASASNYEILIPRMTNHPKDRHVLAAAVQGRADVLITSNLRDFPSLSLEPYDLSARTPDSLLCQFFEEVRDPVTGVIVEHARQYRRPAMSVGELLARLEKHVPMFAARCTAHVVEHAL